MKAATATSTRGTLSRMIALYWNFSHALTEVGHIRLGPTVRAARDRQNGRSDTEIALNGRHHSPMPPASKKFKAVLVLSSVMCFSFYERVHVSLGTPTGQNVVTIGQVGSL